MCRCGCIAGVDVHIKKDVGRLYVELVFLHSLGSTGQVVHYGVPGVRIMMHYFSCSGGTGIDSIKSVLARVTPNLCFCILWDLRVM
jgi:hypothetical protein